MLAKRPKIARLGDRVFRDLGHLVRIGKALGGFFGTVRLQDPGSGQAPKGSTITLTIV